MINDNRPHAKKRFVDQIINHHMGLHYERLAKIKTNQHTSNHKAYMEQRYLIKPPKDRKKTLNSYNRQIAIVKDNQLLFDKLKNIHSGKYKEPVLKHQLPNNQFLNRHCYYPSPNKNSLSPEKRYTHENDSSFELSTPAQKVELPPVKNSVRKVLNRLESQSKKIAERERIIKQRLAENGRFSNSFDDQLENSFAKSNSGSINNNNLSYIKKTDNDFDSGICNTQNSRPTLPKRSRLQSNLLSSNTNTVSNSGAGSIVQHVNHSNEVSLDDYRYKPQPPHKVRTLIKKKLFFGEVPYQVLVIDKARTLIHISAENMLNHKVIKLEVVNEKAKQIRENFASNYEEFVYKMQIKNNKIILDNINEIRTYTDIEHKPSRRNSLKESSDKSLLPIQESGNLIIHSHSTSRNPTPTPIRGQEVVYKKTPSKGTDIPEEEQYPDDFD